jgi:hypothetical protein
MATNEYNGISFYTATDVAFDGRFTDPGYNPPQEENITTINAKIDRSLWNPINELMFYPNGAADMQSERPVPFPLWASAEPGQLAVQCTDDIMPHLVEERAAVVITNAYKMKNTINEKFDFAGVVRTRFACPKDNGAIGPAGDEYFTLTIGGKVQLLNNSGEQLKVGDCVGWTFGPNTNNNPPAGKRKWTNTDGPRQILLKKCQFTDPYKIGKVTSTVARNGAFVDILLQATTL